MKAAAFHAGAACLLFILVGPVTHAEEPTRDSPMVELSGPWQYRWGDSPKDAAGIPRWTYEDMESPEWKPMSLPGWAPGRNGNNYLWQRVRLPEGVWRDPSIFALGPFLCFELYLDDELLYRTANLDTPPTFRIAGTPWHLIRLPQDFHGAMLSFRIFSDYYLIGMNDRVFLGDRGEIVTYMIRRDLVRMITGALCLFLGFFSVFIYVRNHSLKEFLSFGFFAVWIGAYIVRGTYLKQFLADFHAIWTYLWLFSIYLIPVGFIAFVEQVFGAGYRSFIRRLWQVHIGISVIMLTFAIVFPAEFAYTCITTARLLYVVYIGILVVKLTIAALKKSIEAVLVLFGFGLLAFFGLFDVLVGFGVIVRSRPLAYIGMFAFVLTISVILERRLRKVDSDRRQYSHRLETMSREREEMVRELHDGISGIMTNIKLLAEIARKTDKRETDEHLSVISSLSQEALLEIRNFMQSLDEKEITWDLLAAEFRIQGTNTLKPHGIRFTIDATIDPTMQPPSPLLFLNIYRIYRESLTNIIKHADAKTVGVVLRVAPEAIELSVADDGTGLEGESRVGRGIENMKRRAKELGGVLSVVSENGTRVHLSVRTGSATECPSCVP